MQYTHSPNQIGKYYHKNAIRILHLTGRLQSHPCDESAKRHIPVPFALIIYAFLDNTKPHLKDMWVYCIYPRLTYISVWHEMKRMHRIHFQPRRNNIENAYRTRDGSTGMYFQAALRQGCRWRRPVKGDIVYAFSLCY